VDEGDLDLLECRAVRMRSRPFTRFVGAMGYVGAAWLALPLLATGNVVLGATIAALLAFSVYRSFVSRRRRGGWVKLEQDGLRVTCGGARRSWPRAQIVGAYRLPLALGASVQMANGSELVFELLPDEHGPAGDARIARTLANVERVLSHVGMGPSQRAVRAPLRGTIGAFTKGLLAFFFGGWASFIAVLAASRYLGGAGFLVGFAMTCAFTALVVSRYGFPYVVVGADGIRIRGGLRTRFIPFADVRAVDATHGVDQLGMTGVQLTTTRSRELLPLIGQSLDQRNALVERIRAGREAYLATAGGRPLEALDRAGRPVAAWKANLERLAASEGGFREQPLGKDDFERVLADPRAPLDRRVGAALALRVADPSASVRIRVASESSADERVAAALQAASDGEIHEDVLDSHALAAPPASRAGQ